MPNLQIQLNDRIIDRYVADGLSLEYLGSSLLVLMGLYEEQYELLDKFDDSNKEKRVLILYRYLVRKGLLEEIDDEETLYGLTEKGVSLVQFIKSEYGYPTEGVLGEDRPLKTPETTVVITEDVSTWVQDWINLFPEGKIEGRYLRSSKTECADRLRWFLKNYGYDRETIFKATRAYLQSQQNSPNGHTYTRNANYFIFKGRSKHERTSDLATWCQGIMDSKDGEIISPEDAFNRLV